MLTLPNIKQFRQELSNLITITDELIKVRTEVKMFKNSDDYYTSLNSCKFFPSDYYKVRLFDTEIYLFFNNRQKIYTAKFEAIPHYDFMQRYDVLDFCKEHDIKILSDDRTFQFSQEKVFDEIVREFIYLIKLFTEYLLTKDSLFNFYGLQ